MRKTWFAVPLAATLAGVTLAGLAAWGFAGSSPSKSTSETTTDSASVLSTGAGDASALESPAASAAATPSPKAAGALAPTPSATQSKARRANAGVPLPRRSVDLSDAPPSVPRRGAPLPGSNGCPYYVGVNAPKTVVRTALEIAAQTPFWANDPRYTGVTLPPALIKAVAWQESGWQSQIMACDGGIGTMQVMPATATWMNERFGTSYDVRTLNGNTMIGAAYLQWLIAYFGYVYFGSDYTLDAADCVSTDPNVPNYQTPCLLNAVIAAYNYGYLAVDVGDHIVIPNPDYVRPVRALMVSCPCFAY
ncbi:MAG: lytic transglycosylase domain-containing protein [Hamadaea sp.]|uniref:lytic transglycosylase domain-containing protein n=1 Tax=Hamadaea sp. TaxID=2024425 RepID=UPI00183E16EE|nr:lytic transglycosylase domain-containing protein [Hamadaea sp.]NUR74268.1 lytic transglycosylase domain-containing protein [Hamadaea sp.]NUT21530.1 lytic transglycosylase domain-containing protein [Hamadaea sp.]